MSTYIYIYVYIDTHTHVCAHAMQTHAHTYKCALHIYNMPMLNTSPQTVHIYIYICTGWRAMQSVQWQL